MSVTRLPDPACVEAIATRAVASRPSVRSRHRRRQRGFSLLEVLVAFAILALSLGVLLQIFGQATLATLTSSTYSRAAAVAESRLNEVGFSIPLEEGAVSGEPEDGFEWEVTIVQVELDGFFLPQIVPYRINAKVIWEDGGRPRSLTLSTLRLGTPL